MKRIVIIFILIFQASLAQNAFEQGNQFYQKEQYQQAITSYESILSSGKQSSELYFNLGNSYYKLHKLAPAIYNYEKALQLNPNDNEIKTNLDFARKATVDDIKILPKVGFHKIISDFTSKYYYDTWAKIAVGFAFLFFVLFLGFYFSFSALRKRVFFTAMFVALLAIFLSVFAAIFEKNRINNTKPAIVFSETAQVKNEPKLNAPDAFILHEGTKVFIVESIANWKKIELTDETTGWIQENAIKELN
jgi:tetratricopeptide (TPR) repeat protein